MERLCLTRLTPHVAATGHFNPLQSAYRKHHSTKTALLKILDDLYRIIDDRRSAVLVGLDLSAAFDTIEHDILIERLQTVFGVSGTALSWVETYLRQRKQYVMASGERSSSIQCDYRVPQGLVLGPFLFSVYVSPIADVITSHSVQFHQYADDTQLYIVSLNLNLDIKTLEECLLPLSGTGLPRTECYWIRIESEVLLVVRRSNVDKFAGGTGICIAGSQITYSVKL